jgi:hypothetical protein
VQANKPTPKAHFQLHAPTYKSTGSNPTKSKRRLRVSNATITFSYRNSTCIWSGGGDDREVTTRQRRRPVAVGDIAICCPIRTQAPGGRYIK